MRGLQAQYQCKHCNQLFTARVADRQRRWAQFCSKSCKQHWQEQGRRIFAILKKRRFG